MADVAPKPTDQPQVPEQVAAAQNPPNPQIDQGWSDFVGQHSASAANENDTTAATNDSGWNDFLNKNADKATQPSILSQVGSGIGEAAHVANMTLQGIGAGVNNTAVDIFKSITTVPDIKPNEAYEQQVSDDLSKFRNSKGYLDSADKFSTLVSDVFAPQIKNFVGQAYIDQAKATANSVTENIGPPEGQSETIGEALERTMNAVAAPFQVAAAVLGFDAAAQIFAQPIAEKLYPDNTDLQKQYSQGFGQMAGQLPFFIPESGAKPPAIQVLQDSGILKGEDAYFNEPSKTPLDEIKINEPEAQPEEKQESSTPEKPAAEKTINDVVRENEPELFKQYDDITDQQDRLRTWLGDLRNQRESEGDIAETQGKIDALLAKVKGVEDRLTNKQANALEDLRDQLDDVKSKDTPDMARVRQQLLELDNKRRDMAEQVSAAYRTAQEQMPKPVEVKAPEVQQPHVEEGKPIPVLNGAGEAKAAPELSLKPGEQSGSLDIGSQVKGNESPKFDIASDVSKKLVEAGRPTEEADANGKITAQIYKYFSDVYGGAKGTAEDWYKREGAVIAKHGERVKQLAQKGKELGQGVQGRYRPATAAAKAIIRLLNKSDASTFIHESAHHYLDMMVKFANEADAPEKLKADVTIIREWLGKEKGQFSGFTREQHESFARGFERYLHEGVAPTKEMAGVFAKFKQWMEGIYKTVRDIPGQKIPINDNIRNVFDRMLGGEGNREIVIAPELPLKTSLKDNIESPALKNLFGSVPKSPQSLSEFLSSSGGLKGNADLEAMDAHKAHIDLKTGRAKPFVKNLIQEDGLDIDGNKGAAMKAWKAGYFPELDRPPTEAEFSDNDHQELNNYNEALKYNAEVDKIANETGIDPEGKTHDDFWDAVAEHYNEEKRFNEAHDMAEDARIDAEKLEEKEREFIESRGDSWEPPKEPDHVTLEDLENARKQEQAAAGQAPRATTPTEPTSPTGSQGLGEAGVRQVGSDIEPNGRTGQVGTEEASPAGNEPAGGKPDAAAESARADERDTAAGGKQAETADASINKGKSYYVDKKGVINFDLFKTPEDFERYLQEYADAHPDRIDEAVGGVQTLDKVVELSKATGLTTKELLNRKVGELYDGPKQVAAAQFFIQQTEKLKAEADAAHASGDPQKILDFMNSLEDRHDYINMFLQQKGLSAEASRALGARRAIRKLEGFNEAMNVGELFQRVTGVKMDRARAQADLFAGLTDTAQVARLAQKTRMANWLDYMIAYRNNNILSGPVTHLHYADGNLINLLYKPAKVAVASVLPGGPDLGEAGAMYNSLVMGSQKAWTAAKSAWQDGIDISYQDISENYKRPTQVVFNQTFDKFFGANSPVGKSIRSIHTFFYTMNSEMIKSQYAFRQALDEGLEEKSQAFNNRVSDLITNQSPEMMAKIDAEAKESMYLKNPDYNSFLGHFNAISNRTYVGRALLPFAKIEMNVKLMARDNTILGLFSKDVRADLMGENGSEARAIRIAGMSMGTSLFGVALGAGDMINGNGPSNNEERKVWLLTHTPNSIQIGDVSIPLRALGTPGQILLAGAEMREAFQEASEPEAKNMAANFMQHVSNVMFKGTFVQNASETVNAFTNPVQS